MLQKLSKGLIAGAAILAATAGTASAQNNNISLQDVLNAARAEQRAARAADQQREAEFLAERNRQAARLAEVRRQVDAADAESDRLAAEYEQNDATIGELTSELQAAQGDFGELFGAARSAAGDFAAQLQDSVISAQFPGRVEPLQEIAQSDKLPSDTQLRYITDVMFEQIVAQSNTSTFDATVVNARGENNTGTITRIGPFVAFDSSGNYYTMQALQDGRARLKQLARNPGTADAVANARGVAGFSGDGLRAGTIDPSLGQILGLVIETPTLEERFHSGGIFGYFITGILVLGVLIGVYKLVTLSSQKSGVKSQMRRKSPSRGNALGRIMMAYDSNTNADTETLALKLDDAVLKELPKLDSGLNLLKVLAAIAPLVGLLGTVVGMIQTFQQITLFGTGDPQIMAGGISLALITTAMGLIAAIPLLLLHALASGTARSIGSILEEQAAGMIAAHAETR
ncbi:MotA/TolQ/ExbB proton channel family protein [Parvularcula sp. ZS-1/3]|uniref:MotA/TolQ/ExbB proton channel family protein n=1 Tax=Parvularcula mediterranea TaxID=2732508 RepID=A0A7Y3RJK7_9PROT|nr:MotA/TolQ/ExbB proton channel family protein [Parvularcula mediterranea]NNU15211.1 MotA/TolQ/ExbB proton channel family protein [Parvularcula mediterranea]